MSRVQLLIKYLKNARISEYDEMLKKAKAYDYEVISLRDYIEEDYDKRKKLLILRHDVDHLSEGTQKMFVVEKKYAVRSSFYFRNSTFEPLLMKEIESYGSEASLHYEPIADFVKANGIKSKEALFAFEDWEERCVAILKANLERFRSLLNLPCVTIASHGEYENRLVQTPNNYLTEDTQSYASFGIKLEAYNQEMIEQVSCYISDVPIEINEGYKYGTTAFEAIENKEKFILFLTHPNHWHYSLWKQFKKLIKVILKGPSNQKVSFKRL